MEHQTSSEAKENIVSFTKRYIELLKQKKVIDHDIKTLKEEFKEEGVPVAVVTKAFNAIKSEKRKSDSEIFEYEKIKEWLEAERDVSDGVEELNSKA